MTYSFRHLVGEGRVARLVESIRSAQQIVREYTDYPDVFELQFSSHAHCVDRVASEHQFAADVGLSSYLDVMDVEITEQHVPLAHVRIDWRLEQQGWVGIHGGTPQPIPQQREIRAEAWYILLAALSIDPKITHLTTCTPKRNLRAARFIQKSGFQPFRTTRTPLGNNDTVHFVLPTSLVSGVLKSAGVNVTQVHVPRMPSAKEFLPTPLHSPSLQFRAPLTDTPHGWVPITELNANEWVSTAFKNPSKLAHFFGDEPGIISHPEHILGAMRFNARHGFSYFGHMAKDQSGPDGLIIVQRFPKYPTWVRLYGGPMAGNSDLDTKAIQAWLQHSVGHEGLERAEVLVSPVGPHRNFWQSIGFRSEHIDNPIWTPDLHTFSALFSDFAVLL